MYVFYDLPRSRRPFPLPICIHWTFMSIPRCENSRGPLPARRHRMELCWYYLPIKARFVHILVSFWLFIYPLYMVTSIY